MTIDKTIKSKYQPKQTNVTWVDLSGKTPIEKHFINGRWREMSGGGSAGSSNPTEADATKVWQVTPVQKGTETKIETVEIFPEQELWASSSVDNTQNVDKFNVGNMAIVTINGVTYTSEIQDDDGSSQVVIVTNPDDETLSNTFYITNHGGIIDFDFNNRIPPQPTVASLSVEDIQETPIYDYNWAPGVKIPIPTAEDEGKILVVNEVEVGSKEYELAPTQTVTIARGITELQNTSNLDKFVEGATAAVVIDGITYTEQVINNDGDLGFEIDSGEAIYIVALFKVNGETKFGLTGSPGTYEVSVSVLEKEYSYEYQLQNDGNGFKYNELPELTQFRDPENEVEFNPEIFGVHNGMVLKVLDLKNGIVPKEIIIENSNNGAFEIYQLTGYKFDINKNQVYYCMCVADSSATDIVTAFDGSGAFISKDGTLLGILDMGAAL